MKNFIFLICCLGSLLFSQNGRALAIDSLKIIPENPTTLDEVKLVAFTFHFQQSCHVISSEEFIYDDSIKVSALHNLGPLPNLCNRSDTFNLGNLEAGTYILRHCISHSISPNSFQKDSIEFTVLLVDNIIGIENLPFDITPRYHSGSVFINFYDNAQSDFIDLEIYSISGHLIRRLYSGYLNIDLSEYQIDQGLQSGIYILKIGYEGIDHSVKFIVD